MRFRSLRLLSYFFQQILYDIIGIQTFRLSKKARSTRCRSPDLAITFTSSQDTLGRPESKARALPARINAWAPLEPAPHLTRFWMSTHHTDQIEGVKLKLI